MPMLTIAHFDSVSDAYLAKGRLEAEGIPCQLIDEHMASMNLFFGIANGGIKLQVEQHNKPAAVEILAQDHSHTLPGQSS